MRRKSQILATVVAVLLFTSFAAPLMAAPAAQPNTVLILGTSVSGGASSIEAQQATAQGFNVEIADAAAWGAKTTADFATYQAIILGDPTCGSVGAIAAAEANRAVWGAAITGNVLVIGTDEVFHTGQGGLQLTQSGIGFVTDAVGTGAYISLSCYYDGVVPTNVTVLEPFGTFTARDAGCFDDAHIVASHPALAGSTDATLSNWGCSVHNLFSAFPASFATLAIAEGAGGTGTLTFPDGSTGVPYILARGEGLVTLGCGNGVIDTAIGEQCDDGNTANGDGCSSSCRFETGGFSVTKTTSTAGPVTVGDEFNYILTVTNAGATAVTGVTVNDPLPAAVERVSVTTTQGTCTGTSTIACSLGTINASSSATVTIRVRAVAPGNTSNVATIDSTETTTIVGAPASLTIEGPPIPTASEWGLILLAAMLGLAGIVLVKR